MEHRNRALDNIFWTTTISVVHEKRQRATHVTEIDERSLSAA